MSIGPYIAEVMADTPLAFWLLDELTGTTADDFTTNNINGTYSGVTLNGDKFLDGKAAANWPTQTQKITFTRQSGSMGAGQDWSGGGWIRTTSSDGTSGYAGNAALNMLGDHSANIWNSFGVHGGVARYARFNNAGAAWQYQTGTKTVNDGHWHYIVFTAAAASEANNVKVYVDGVLDTQGQLAVSVHGSASLGFDTIGAGYLDSSGYNDGFLGAMRGAWIKKAVLTAARIKSHYDAGIRAGASY